MLRSFDILMFSGAQMYPSRTIEWLTRSDFSHVAMFLSSPTYIDERLRGKDFVLESGEEVRPCVLGGEMAWGVQIQPWEFIYATYPGKIYSRRLTWTVSDDECDTESIEQKLASAWNETKHAGYDMNPIDFLRADSGRALDGACQKTNEFICSAYLTFLLVRLGVLPPTTKWDTFVPRDFIPGGRIDKALVAYGRARLDFVMRVLKT